MPNENKPDRLLPFDSYSENALAAHMVERHGWNRDTVSIRNDEEWQRQHRNYHSHPGEDHYHSDAGPAAQPSAHRSRVERPGSEDIKGTMAHLLSGTKKLLDTQIAALSPHVAGDALIGTYHLMVVAEEALTGALAMLGTYSPEQG